MRKKLILILAMFTMSVSIFACGAKETETETEEIIEVTEEAVATATPEESVTQQTSSKVDNKEEAIIEQAEEVQEKVSPVWYMDEEGVKSEELGIVIKRDSAEWSEFGFSGSYVVNVPSDESNTTLMSTFNFQCNYYEGDIDSYITEHEGMEKKTLENMVYAVKEPQDEFDYRECVIVGNGIVLSIILRENNMEDIWKAEMETGLDVYEGEVTDCFAYIENGSLYCPALDIMFSGYEKDVVSNYVRVNCSDFKYDASSSGGYINISNNKHARGSKSAEEMVDEYVEFSVHNFEDTAIDKVFEEILGNYSYIGKGYSSSTGSNTWEFASDETPWELTIWHTEEYEVNKYLSLIETLK